MTCCGLGFFETKECSTQVCRVRVELDSWALAVGFFVNEVRRTGEQKQYIVQGHKR